MNNTTAPKPFVFVLMPFDPVFDDVYKLGIKAAAIEAGGYCERVDEQIFEERMLDRIYNQINKADVIIADLTGKNPNVFYETGYAHALEKKVILLTQHSEDIPFDLKHHYHIVYEGSITNLKDELTRRLKWYFDNPLNKQINGIQQVDIYFRGQKLEQDLRINNNTNNGSFIELSLDIYNASAIPFGLNTKIGFELPTELGYEGSRNSGLINFKNKDKTVSVCEHYLDVILPNCWSNLKINLIRVIREELYDVEIPIKIIIYTEAGMSSIDFFITNKSISSR